MPAAWRSLFQRPPAQRVAMADCALLVRQLAVLQKAGVPLLSSLQAFESQLSASALQQALQRIRQDLLDGHTLSQAFARQPHSFDQTFVSMIQVGELGGRLDEVLGRLTALLEWELELRAKVRQALQYPIIVLATLAIALGLMATFVLPNFANLFSSFSIPLPLQTRLLMALSRFLAAYGWLVVLVAIAGGVAAAWYVRTERGRLRWHTLLLRLPGVGPLIVQLAMSRFSRTVSALTASGVPILEVLALAGQSVDNAFVQQRVAALRERVRGGKTFSGALRQDGLFPAVVTQMVATGEESGQLDELLRSVSEYYDQQVSYAVKAFIGYLEPALLLLVGLGVLVMASAVLVPMWDLVHVFKQTGG